MTTTTRTETAAFLRHRWERAGMGSNDEQVERVAQVVARAALDWTDVEGADHEHTLDCTNWQAYLDDARAALDAAGVGDLTAEVERLRRWKDEALPVMAGLQDLGRALGLPLGKSITGEAAAEKARNLRQQVADLRGRVEALTSDNGCVLMDDVLALLDAGDTTEAGADGRVGPKFRGDGPGSWHNDHLHALDGECLHGYDETTYDDRTTPTDDELRAAREADR